MKELILMGRMKVGKKGKGARKGALAWHSRTVSSYDNEGKGISLHFFESGELLTFSLSDQYINRQLEPKIKDVFSSTASDIPSYLIVLSFDPSTDHSGQQSPQARQLPIFGAIGYHSTMNSHPGSV